MIFHDDTAEHHDIIHFAAGTFNSTIDIKPNAHIYLESKADWSEFDVDLPKLETNRSSKKIG